MNIIFVCSCLEPGKDGVGDFCRNLAIKLTKAGHGAGLLSLHDAHMKDACFSEQVAGTDTLKLLRLSARLSVQRKRALAKTFLIEFNPDWVSIHYVPFSFHPKGLHRLLGFHLRRIIKPVPVHVMFHELWVNESGWKFQLWRTAQRIIIWLFVKMLQPALISTQIPLYQNRLKSLLHTPIAATPICSNIDSFAIRSAKLDGVFVVGIFSQFHLPNHLRQALTFLQNYCLQLSYKLELHLIGGNDQRAIALSTAILQWDLLEAQNIKRFSHLSEIAVSACLYNCSLGLSAVPFDMAGKSGSTLAFIAHGIPVVMVGGDTESDSAPFFDQELTSCIVKLPRTIAGFNLPSVSETARNKASVQHASRHLELLLAGINT